MARNKASIGDASRTVRANSMSSPSPGFRLSRPTAGVAELSQDARNHLRARRVGVRQLIFEAEALPLEGAHLVERQDLDPFDVLHRRHEPCEPGHVRGIVAESWHQHEADPYRLADARQPFGKVEGWLHILLGDALVG